MRLASRKIRARPSSSSTDSLASRSWRPSYRDSGPRAARAGPARPGSRRPGPRPASAGALPRAPAPRGRGARPGDLADQPVGQEHAGIEAEAGRRRRPPRAQGFDPATRGAVHLEPAADGPAPAARTRAARGRASPPPARRRPSAAMARGVNPGTVASPASSRGSSNATATRVSFDRTLNGGRRVSRASRSRASWSSRRTARDPRGQIARALQARVGVGIAERSGAGSAARASHSSSTQARRPAPCERLHQPVLQGDQVLHVGGGVALLLRRERARRPVVLLARGRQLDAEVLRDQHVEAEGPAPEEARGDRGVEEPGEAQSVAALQVREVVVPRVDHGDDRGIGKDRRQGGEVAQGQRCRPATPRRIPRRAGRATGAPGSGAGCRPRCRGRPRPARAGAARPRREPAGSRPSGTRSS